MHTVTIYIILVAGIAALIASVYPIPYMLFTLWNWRTHRVRMFYFSLWVVNILMGFHHIVYFISAVTGYVPPPSLDVFWVMANLLVCLIWIPIFIEVKHLKKIKRF